MPKSPMNKSKRSINYKLGGQVFNYVFTNNKKSNICPICDNRAYLFYNQNMNYFCCVNCNLKHTNISKESQAKQEVANYVRQQFT
jgi:uncharacterized protein YhbP (UPF0306 family)